VSKRAPLAASRCFVFFEVKYYPRHRFSYIFNHIVLLTSETKFRTHIQQLILYMACNNALYLDAMVCSRLQDWQSPCKRILCEFPVALSGMMRTDRSLSALFSCLAVRDLGLQRKRNWVSGMLQFSRIAGVARLSSSSKSTQNSYTLCASLLENVISNVNLGLMPDSGSPGPDTWFSLLQG
jgi:hypothetical protein